MSGYNYYIQTDIGGRAENQDFVLTQQTPYGFVMIVCDGMGGANGGRLASETAAKAIADFFKSHVLEGFEDERVYFLSLLKKSIELANDKVYQLSQSSPDLRGMGTTACIVLLRKNKAYLAHVGDSRIYHINGKKFRHTDDHSRVFEMYKNEILTKEQARVHPESNIITRALGIGEAIEGSYEEVAVDKEHRLILCTDGIWGVYPERELIKKFNAKATLKGICDNLISDINKKYNEEGKRHDNLSIGILSIYSLEDVSSSAEDSGGSEDGEAHKEEVNIEASLKNRSLTSSYILISFILLAIIAFFLFFTGSFK